MKCLHGIPFVICINLELLSNKSALYKSIKRFVDLKFKKHFKTSIGMVLKYYIHNI